ncbi:MAG: hypothetical protein IIC41_01965 [Candidatus Marinimicrobia bacterium]|nr:hypothetical protein [Candidatus Neomarinimicrobiota bacterium]
MIRQLADWLLRLSRHRLPNLRLRQYPSPQTLLRHQARSIRQLADWQLRLSRHRHLPLSRPNLSQLLLSLRRQPQLRRLSRQFLWPPPSPQPRQMKPECEPPPRR